MKNKLLSTTGIAIAAAFVLGSTPSWADPISITNPSFESPDVADGVSGVAATGWTNINVWDPLVGQVAIPNIYCTVLDPTQAFIDAIPNGDQVAYSNGNDASQTTAETITEGYRYTLKVSVGGRCDGLSSNPYLVQILGDGAPVASTGGNNQANTWVEHTTTYNSPDSDPNAGKTIGVALINDGGAQLNWDVVTLDATEVLSCDGFFSPFDNPLVFKKKVKRAIPVKMVLTDVHGNELTDADLSSTPPIVRVTAASGTGSGIDEYEGDLLPPGLSDDGNEFRYDWDELQWIINLATKPYTGSAEYTVSVLVDGFIVEGCSETFERL